MSTPNWKKIGARARQRGYRFEKRVAELLKWQRVPFSGANVNFGEGDVIDGYINGAGWWVAECKMRTGASVSVDGAWIVQAVRCGERSGRVPIIVTGNKHDTSSQPEAFVFLNREAWAFLKDSIVHDGGAGTFPAEWLEPDFTIETKTTSLTGGFCVRRSVLDRLGVVRHLVVIVTSPFGTRDTWHMLTLDLFKDIVQGVPGAMVYNTHKEDD